MKNPQGSGNIVGEGGGSPQACSEILYTEQHNNHDEDEDDDDEEEDGDDNNNGNDDDDLQEGGVLEVNGETAHTGNTTAPK